MPQSPSPRSILAAFDHVEEDLADFIRRVPLVPEHLPVWSPSLVRCIFDACSQLDSLWKLRAGTGSNVTISDHFAAHRLTVGSEWLLVWDGHGLARNPFAGWSQSSYTPLAWWSSYNRLKHNRWENVKEATLEHAVDAASGLFLAIALDAECADALAERKWFHTSYALQYALDYVHSAPEKVPGITIESRLFSYAIGSSKPDFSRMLAAYHNCSRRFGKWLEAKYNRSVVF